MSSSTVTLLLLEGEENEAKSVSDSAVRLLGTSIRESASAFDSASTSFEAVEGATERVDSDWVELPAKPISAKNAADALTLFIDIKLAEESDEVEAEGELDKEEEDVVTTRMGNVAKDDMGTDVLATGLVTVVELVLELGLGLTLVILGIRCVGWGRNQDKPSGQLNKCKYNGKRACDLLGAIAQAAAVHREQAKDNVARSAANLNVGQTIQRQEEGKP